MQDRNSQTVQGRAGEGLGTLRSQRKCISHNEWSLHSGTRTGHALTKTYVFSTEKQQGPLLFWRLNSASLRADHPRRFDRPFNRMFDLKRPLLERNSPSRPWPWASLSNHRLFCCHQHICARLDANAFRVFQLA